MMGWEIIIFFLALAILAVVFVMTFGTTRKAGFAQICDDNLPCNDNLRCVSRNGDSICLKVIGQSCSTSNDCVSGTCVGYLSNVRNGICVPGDNNVSRITTNRSGRAGALCDTKSDCKSGLVCHSGVCTNPSDLNEICNTNSDCSKGFKCIDGVCKSKKDGGNSGDSKVFVSNSAKTTMLDDSKISDPPADFVRLGAIRMAGETREWGLVRNSETGEDDFLYVYDDGEWKQLNADKSNISDAVMIQFDATRTRFLILYNDNTIYDAVFNNNTGNRTKHSKVVYTAMDDSDNEVKLNSLNFRQIDALAIGNTLTIGTALPTEILLADIRDNNDNRGIYYYVPTDETFVRLANSVDYNNIRLPRVRDANRYSYVYSNDNDDEVITTVNQNGATIGTDLPSSGSGNSKIIDYAINRRDANEIWAIMYYTNNSNNIFIRRLSPSVVDMTLPGSRKLDNFSRIAVADVVYVFDS